MTCGLVVLWFCGLLVFCVLCVVFGVGCGVVARLNKITLRILGLV